MIQEAYELLARCKHLVLAGVDDDGDLEWIGTYQHWTEAEREKENILHLHDTKKKFSDIWR